MPSNTLSLIAGYAAILAPPMWLVALGAGTASPALTLPLLAIATVVFLVVVYALYLIHSVESSGMALGAVLLTANGMIASFFAGDPSIPVNATFYGFSSVIFGIGIVLFGWLAYNSTTMPRGLAMAALVAGVVSLLAGLGYLGGPGLLNLANILNFGSIIPFFVWMVWLGRLFISGQLVTVQVWLGRDESAPIK